MHRLRVLALTVGPSLLVTSPVSGDSLVLRTGKSLRIESLECDAQACRARVAGGEVVLSPADIVRVDADEIVDPEPAPPAPNGSATQRSPRSIEEIVAESARAFALPISLVRAVARAESAFRSDAVSPKGALGVMQLMPDTARRLGVKDAFDPEENIPAGARLLRQLLEKYEGRVAEALAAYNAGEGAVARHQGVPPYRETRGYIRKVVKDFNRNGGAAATATPKPESRP